MWPFKKTPTHVENPVNVVAVPVSPVIADSVREVDKSKTDRYPTTSYGFPGKSFFRRGLGSNPALTSPSAVVTTQHDNDLKDIGLDRLDFTLIECCDWVGPTPRCRRCGTGFSDYLIHTIRGETWHSKCFSTFVCPDFTESAEDLHDAIKAPDINSNEEPVALTERSPASESNSTDISMDSVAESRVEEFSKNHGLGVQERDFVIQMEDSAAPKSSPFISFHTTAAAESDGKSELGPVESVSTTTGRALSWAIQLEYMTRANNDLMNNKGQVVLTPHPVSVGDEAVALNISDPAPPTEAVVNDIDAIVAELNDLGKFRYRNVTSRNKIDGVTALEIERELEAWSSKVDLALNRSIKLFPAELFCSNECFDGSCDGLSITFTSHSSVIMHAIRLRFGITAQEFAKSFSLGDLDGGNKGEGKSGNFMWSTCDSRFVLKTISREEFNFLNKLLPSYYEHMILHGTHTLLCRFMGLYTIKVANGYPVTVIIMNNVFYHPPNPLFRAAHVIMDEVFDLKGSAISRLVSQDGI